MSWLWLVTNNLQLGSVWSRKLHQWHAKKSTRYDDLGATVPFFPKGRVRELSTWPWTGFLSCAEHVIPSHLTWTVLLKEKIKGKE